MSEINDSNELSKGIFPTNVKKLTNIKRNTPAYWLNIKTLRTKSVLPVESLIRILTL